MKKALTDLRLHKNEFKSEIILILFAVVFMLAGKHIPFNIIDNLESYLKSITTSDRISLLTNISAIFIGVYTNVLIVLATSKLNITELVLKKNMDKRILTVIIVGILEDFLLIVVAFFEIDSYLLIIYATLVVLVCISFCKFMANVYRMFKLNINKMVKEIDNENKKWTDLVVKIDEELYILKKLDSNHGNSSHKPRKSDS